MNNRKRQVILASLKLFAKKGFHSTSIQDILDEAHISKGTFYNYFSSKKDCLVAILEIGRSDATLRKAELLIGKNLSDKSVLAAQISTIMQVNRERDLLPIFESILHSGDQELKKIVKEYHLKEMEWLSRRLVDVYGERIVPYRYDATILLFGMIHQMLHIGSMTAGEAIDPVVTSKYALRQLDLIVPSLIENNDYYLGPDLQNYIFENTKYEVPTRDEILDQLKGFRSCLESDIPESCIEYTDCLIEEFSMEKPRYYIIGTIAYQFYNSFRDSKHALETIEIANEIWKVTRANKGSILKK
ncbi:MAG: TetR/AcrR family transcriptional regulator [Kurthia gibsonii]|uniref:TetR/AcrR family transcriptional regulator n=1 Tax=Kurthia gibsonii TaxID=33946 RepID=A0ABU9LKG4_9BACL|nr:MULTISPECIES: TetR/AcrR family transcriptional regulator [Kurthia]AMA62368.1 bacterial regulatory s, tetR family protein [Kurthia sp. 11kri321]MEB6113358.1 TetR/AcrR family transcriptional regulator [Kurthia gibsonii]RXH52215.1 TetR/AcrR family transcriptional regulator [Kurthia gibsonii]WIL38024.1 TetR/AcrR family transcriptional regulator [Kurthia sp. YJT4]HZG13269.1 TetR/AcrR family transcriptional regulator [Kurthia gibsonii]